MARSKPVAQWFQNSDLPRPITPETLRTKTKNLIKKIGSNDSKTTTLKNDDSHPDEDAKEEFDQ